METISKCIAIALSEMGKLSFSGATLIPAGKVMEALRLAANEIEELKAGKAAEERKEETNGDS